MEPLLGVVVIGLASASMLYFNDKTAGISGIFRGLLTPVRGNRMASNVHLKKDFGGTCKGANFSADVC